MCSDTVIANSLDGETSFELLWDIWPGIDADAVVANLKKAWAYHRNVGASTSHTRRGREAWQRVLKSGGFKSDCECATAIAAALTFVGEDLR